MNINEIAQYAAYVLIAIGVMAFLVSVITQVIKELPWFAHTPTAVVVFILSMVICPLSLSVLLAWLSRPFSWYLFAASMIAAFIVALVAMDGWERVAEIWQRTKYSDDQGRS